ncbi:hypothetical protein D3C79_946160 [compost metagenome]
MCFPEFFQALVLSFLGSANVFIVALGVLGGAAQRSVVVFVRAAPVHVYVSASAELDPSDVVAGAAVHRRGTGAEGLAKLRALVVPGRYLIVPGTHCGQMRRVG